MLEHTFIHISGIGPKTEQHLWRRGILTWTEFLRHEHGIFSSPARDSYVRRQLEASVDNKNNIAFFLDRLSSPNLWRLFGRFRDRAVYLDIETNGGHGGIDEITLIGLYDGQSVETFINGINLSDFEFAVATYDLVITFNGSQFDLPIIRRHFPHIALPPAHIDLRFFVEKVGLPGGV